MDTRSFRHKIVVVDDDPDILELVRYNLDKDGFKVTCCPDGEEALITIKQDIPDLIILDLMMPGISGMELCRIIRNNPTLEAIKVIMLTARTEEHDVVEGLETGADDYVTKPFSPRVLLARIHALLRRGSNTEAESIGILSAGDVTIHTQKHEARIGESQLPLTKTEYSILLMMARRIGWVYSRAQIVDEIHSEDDFTSERTVDVHINSLRKKLGEHSKIIETVRGVGYRIKAPA